MNKWINATHKFESISDLHRMLDLPRPLHPLISLVDTMDIKVATDRLPNSVMLSFCTIIYKGNLQGKYRYGQHVYDMGEGGLFFIAPNQIIGSSENNAGHTGFILFVHPDFFQTYPLAKKIKEYGFFSYSAHEALHLSDKEKSVIVSIFKIIEDELNSKTDDVSQDVVVSQLELLLNYSNRFYKRQFATRKVLNNDLLHKMEVILDEYFNSGKSLKDGIPTVQYLSECLNISASYLSDMLRSLTGQNAQKHIHHKLIEKAKESLMSTNLSVSEVAYQLGFEHPQSFNKLFKTKTRLSPLEFRRSFN